MLDQTIASHAFCTRVFDLFDGLVTPLWPPCPSSLAYRVLSHAQTRWQFNAIAQQCGMREQYFDGGHYGQHVPALMAGVSAITISTHTCQELSDVIRIVTPYGTQAISTVVFV